MILHDAMPLTENQEIFVNAAAVKDAGVEHILPIEGTRVALDNGDQLVVKETVEEVAAMIAAEMKQAASGNGEQDSS